MVSTKETISYLRLVLMTQKTPNMLTAFEFFYLFHYYTSKDCGQSSYVSLEEYSNPFHSLACLFDLRQFIGSTNRIEDTKIIASHQQSSLVQNLIVPLQFGEYSTTIALCSCKVAKYIVYFQRIGHCVVIRGKPHDN